MSVRKQRPDADHLSGASLSDLLNLDDEENYSDELDDEETPSASAKRKLANFLSVSGNDLCADCGSPDPNWVSANLGAFVCIKCSGVHRSLGVHISKAGMVEFVGMIKVNVVSGTNLVIRDVRSSDPYVMISLGTQSMKTQVLKSSLNPVWNEKLMLSIPHDVPPLKVNVFDKDKFSTDDFMGEAEIDIRPLVSAARALEYNGNANGPSKQLENMDEGKDKNTHVNNGTITVTDGKAKQDIQLKLQKVESGELQIEIECVVLTQ